MLLTDKYTIIYFSNIEWSGIFQRPQHLMAEMAKREEINNIIFIETLGARRIRLTSSDIIRIFKKIYHMFRGYKTISQHIPEKITILSPIAIPIFNKFFYKINELLLEMRLKKILRKLHIDLSESIAWVSFTHPATYEFLEKHKPSKVIYDCIDDMKSIPYLNKDIISCEERFIKESKIVFATSQLLFDKCRNINQNTFLLPNAVSGEMIENPVINKENIIGYIGAIYEWFDLDLLFECAQRFKNCKFEIIGPTRVDISRFNNLENVSFKGVITYEKISEAINSFSVCIIPLKVNELTVNTNPVKLYEYFSKGKPVVSTALPEVERYNEVAYIGCDKEEFLTKLEHALSEDNKELIDKRINIARENTWSTRANYALEVIKSH